MTTFFIGCTHLGHARIIELANRPFKDVQEMDMTMVDKWNRVVRPRDTVWHLGDFAWKNHAGYFQWLNGRKCLIVGNHDHLDTTKLPWERIEHTHIAKFNDHLFHLHHYPLEEWQGYHKKAIHLHSHTHGTRPDIPGRIDVGAERMNYRPISIEEVLERNDIAGWIE